MQSFTGWQYLLIDAANAFGLDKLLFEERIKWAENNLHQLELLVDKAESKPLFVKAVMAIRKAQDGTPTGHLVAMDACCSGIQVMSALTGCIAGATNTGLVDPNVRADAYGNLRKVMQDILGGNVDISRGDAKDALMTSFYGSKAKPKEIFGADTPELAAFYQAAYQIAPGAWELLQELLNTWRPYALLHAWKLPDGYDARVKVMEKKEVRITVDELDRSSFTYEFYVNEGSKTGLSNVANVVHSVDAYVLRCMQRRCNYDSDVVWGAATLIQQEQGNRILGMGSQQPLEMGTKLAYYVEQYQRSGMADVVILPYITEKNVVQMPMDLMDKLVKIIESMLVHKPFSLVTIHDAFKCHPNHMNHLRQHYIDIFAELAESNVLSDILSQLYSVPGTITKLSDNLGELIRKSNYALS